MVDLLVCVDIGSLGEHLLRLSCKHVLVVHLNASLHLLHVLLLSPDLTVLNSLLFKLIVGLEVALGLEIPVDGASSHSL